MSATVPDKRPGPGSRRPGSRQPSGQHGGRQHGGRQNSRHVVAGPDKVHGARWWRELGWRHAVGIIAVVYAL
ncbi:MAG: hypothetical protein LBU50_02335, partial [Cellulomonas sp.]|nr:hypothetical protein [Cellulomonas sp.]